MFHFPGPFKLTGEYLSDHFHAPQTYDQHETTPRDITRVSRTDHHHTPLVHLTASQNDLHHRLKSPVGRRTKTARAY